MSTTDEVIRAAEPQACCAPSAAATAGCCEPAEPVTPAAESTARASAALRPARVSDGEAIRSLLRTAGLPVDGFEAAVESAYVVALGPEDEVVGVAGVEVHGRNGLLRSVAVAMDARGRGLGAALTADRMKWARERGLTAVWALTTTAAAYFPRLGFERAAREAAPAEIRASEEFTSLCPESAQLLVRRLDDGDSIRAEVRRHYAAAARQAQGGGRAGCGCGTGCGCGEPGRDPITGDLYDEDAVAVLPEAAVRASLGCGNPTALAALRPGETVLDLGSGGGIDVLLSARRVGPAGRAYGLDMTDEMLELARRNAAEAGVDNVEFLKGEIERIPLPDASVDVIISNCVINLSADKPTVLREAFRVLRPGGRFAVSDIVVRGEIPAELRRSMELWAGCIAGALEEREFARLLEEVGFEAVDIEPTRVYRAADAATILADAGADGAAAEALDGRFASAFVRATKPGG